MVKRLGVSEARPRLTHVMQEAYYKNTRFILERNGIPMAVVFGIEECKELFEDMEDLKDMLEALKAPKEEWLDYDEYRKERLANVQGEVSSIGQESIG